MSIYLGLLLLASPLGPQEVAQRAVDRSPQIEGAILQRRAAASRVDQAVSELLPRLSLVARYTRLSTINNGPLVSLGLDFEAAQLGIDQIQDPATQSVLQEQLASLRGIDGASIQVPRNRWLVSAGLNYPVSQAFLEILPAIRASEASEKARAIEVQMQQHAVALAAVEAYYGHLLAQEQVRIARLSVASATTAEARAESRRRQGLGTNADVLRFSARRAEAMQSVAVAEADVAETGAAIRVLAGIEGEGPLALVGFVPLRVKEGQVKEALQHRPELRALRMLAQASSHRAQSLFGGVFPTLSGAAELVSADPNPLFVPPPDGFDTNWQLSAVVSWSPDGAWKASRGAEAAKREAEAVQAQAKALEDAVRIEVIGVRARLAAAKAREAASQDGVKAASEGAASVEKGFELGVFDATDLIEAQLELERARLGLIASQVDLRISAARLTTALGQSVLEDPSNH